MRGRESHRGHATSGGLYAVLATILREVVVPPQIENELGILLYMVAGARKSGSRNVRCPAQFGDGRQYPDGGNCSTHMFSRARPGTRVRAWSPMVQKA